MKVDEALAASYKLCVSADLSCVPKTATVRSRWSCIAVACATGGGGGGGDAACRWRRLSAAAHTENEKRWGGWRVMNGKTWEV